MNPLYKNQTSLIGFRHPVRIHPSHSLNKSKSRRGFEDVNKKMACVANNQKAREGGWFNCFPKKKIHAAPIEAQYLPTAPAKEEENNRVEIGVDIDKEEKPQIEQALKIEQSLESQEKLHVSIVQAMPPKKKTVRFQIEPEVLLATASLESKLQKQMRTIKNLRLHIVGEREQILNMLEKRSSIQLVVLDLDVPTLDCLDLVKTIRNRGLDLPIFGASLDSTKQRQWDYMQAGFTGFVLKPVNLFSLTANHILN